MSQIEQFEALAEQLVEGTFARLFAGHLSPLEVAAHLVRAMEDRAIETAEAGAEAPNHFWVYLNPKDYEALSAEQPKLEIELARHLAELAEEANLSLKHPPVVHVLPDETLKRHKVRVEARSIPSPRRTMDRTQEMEPRDEESPSDEKTARQSPTPTPPPGRPFLIVEGKRHINLLDPVISIGRALDNDIIIDDPRISRHHAQLRQRYGHYVLYDLGSSSGTEVNGYPVEECVLHSGDVISFASIQMIYGEDPPTPYTLPESSEEDTSPLPITEPSD